MLALLRKLLIAFKANHADGYKSWLALGIKESESNLVGEIEYESIAYQKIRRIE